MYAPIWELESFDRLPPEVQGSLVLACVEALASIDEIYLAHYPNTPALYRSGVRYRIQGSPDRYFDVPRVLTERSGTCIDLVAWRLAELRLQGTQAFPLVHPQPAGKGMLFHVTLTDGMGVDEDPSALLGMPKQIPMSRLPRAFR